MNTYTQALAPYVWQVETNTGKSRRAIKILTNELFVRLFAALNVDFLGWKIRLKIEINFEIILDGISRELPSRQQFHVNQDLHRSFKWKFQVKFETIWHGLVPSGYFQVASVPLMRRVLTPESVQSTFSSFKLTWFEAVHPPTRKKLFAIKIYTTPNSPMNGNIRFQNLIRTQIHATWDLKGLNCDISIRIKHDIIPCRVSAADELSN